MIVVTRSGSAIAKAAFGKGNVVTSTIDTIIGQLALSPELIQGHVEAYIVYKDDMRSVKAKAFTDAVAGKHPDHKVIIVTRKAGLVQEGDGVDKVLVNPKPDDLARAVDTVVTGAIVHDQDMQSALYTEEETEIPEYTPEVEPEPEPIYTPEEYIEPMPEPEPLPEPMPEPEPEPELHTEVKHSSLVDRIRNTPTVAEMTVLSQQMTASEVIKDIVKNNRQYSVVEDKLKGLSEKICAVFMEETSLTLEEKLAKVNALVIDKNYQVDKNNTVIEEQVDNIIKAITESSIKLINTRLAELDKAILNTKINNVAVDYGRLAGITDERANLFLEVSTLQAEMDTIYANTDKLAADIVSEIATRSSVLTDSPLIDAQLRVHHADIVSGQTFDTMSNILETCNKSSDEFKDAMRRLKVMFRKLEQIIDKDKEAIATLTQIIGLMKANKIEDTVVAETFLKKSMRIFIGRDGEGKSVVPYILSAKKSRTNANVLLVDLTGSSKIGDYTDNYISLKDFMEKGYEKDFCCVVGDAPTEVEEMQKILVALTKAAEFYRVINVVMTPDQIELFDIFAPDALVVNYIVNPQKRTIEYYKDIINVTRVNNVAQRVILNRCDIPVMPILDGLGLSERIDYQFAHIPNVPQLVQCSLTGTAPDQLTQVSEAFREVSEVC